MKKLLKLLEQNTPLINGIIQKYQMTIEKFETGISESGIYDVELIARKDNKILHLRVDGELFNVNDIYYYYETCITPNSEKVDAAYFLQKVAYEYNEIQGKVETNKTLLDISKLSIECIKILVEEGIIYKSLLPKNIIEQLF